MALTKNTDKNKQADQEKTADTSIVLCLSAYENLHMKGKIYRKGQPHRFSMDTARVLLNQMDGTVAVWRMYQEPKVVKPVVAVIADDTKVLPPAEVEDLFSTNKTTGTLEIGDDSELAGILPSEDEDSVTI